MTCFNGQSPTNDDEKDHDDNCADDDGDTVTRRYFLFLFLIQVIVANTGYMLMAPLIIYRVLWAIVYVYYGCDDCDDDGAGGGSNYMHAMLCKFCHYPYLACEPAIKNLPNGTCSYPGQPCCIGVAGHGVTRYGNINDNIPCRQSAYSENTDYIFRCMIRLSNTTYFSHIVGFTSVIS